MDFYSFGAFGDKYKVVEDRSDNTIQVVSCEECDAVAGIGHRVLDYPQPNGVIRDFCARNSTVNFAKFTINGVVYTMSVILCGSYTVTLCKRLKDSCPDFCTSDDYCYVLKISGSNIRPLYFPLPSVAIEYLLQAKKVNHPDTLNYFFSKGIFSWKGIDYFDFIKAKMEFM